MFAMYVNRERVMILSYKPSVDDVIKDDSKNMWFRVLKIEGRKVQARRRIGLGY